MHLAMAGARGGGSESATGRSSFPAPLVLTYSSRTSVLLTLFAFLEILGRVLVTIFCFANSAETQHTKKSTGAQPVKTRIVGTEGFGNKHQGMSYNCHRVFNLSCGLFLSEKTMKMKCHVIIHVPTHLLQEYLPQ